MFPANELSFSVTIQSVYYAIAGIHFKHDVKNPAAFPRGCTQGELLRQFYFYFIILTIEARYFIVELMVSL